mgnify:CR=1 FL=1
MTFKYYGQFDPPVDQFLHERYFRNAQKSLTLIECGAFDGEYESSGKFFEETLGWKAVNVEPSPLVFPRLIRNRPHSININVALSNRNGFAEFHDVHFPGWELCTNGSLNHQPHHREILDQNGCSYETAVVRVITYDALISELGIEAVELMILDVEGHEIEAIEGLERATVRPRVLCIEHGHLGEEPIRRLVEPLGYRFDTSLHVNSYFVRNGRTR